ncbi:MAG: hypothetical protein LQ341_004096, partial [Variospora aurantia]
MYGFEWKDQRGIEGTGFVRALRSLLTAHLPSLLPSLRTIIAEGIESDIRLGRTARKQRIQRRRIGISASGGAGCGSSSNHAPMPKTVDCMQWLIDTSPRKIPWTPERMIGEILALWFGSVHQLAMTTTYAIQDLCLQPYWMQETRSELHRVSQLSSTVDPESLPLLDAFIQESMRVNPSDAISGRRKAIEPFRFSDGLLVKAGDWVCLPQQAMLRDERLYPQPACFNPTRFLRRQKVQDLWPVWGLGNAT